MPNHYLIPNWPAPSSVKACTTLRFDGHSQAPYNSFNFSADYGDDPAAVKNNRMQLNNELGLQREPLWLKQVHGVQAIPAESQQISPEADASYTRVLGQPCVINTADCLPLLLCNRQGTEVAAIHAGWRGLVAGVIENTLEKLDQPGKDWLAWLGPAIGPSVFEVGVEVRDAFLQVNSQAESAFTQRDEAHWLMDIYQLAKQRLLQYGITEVYGGEYCTYSDASRFFSYRRDGGVTGRMASLIWMNEESL